jgi:hypothetical protein
VIRERRKLLVPEDVVARARLDMKYARDLARVGAIDGDPDGRDTDIRALDAAIAEREAEVSEVARLRAVLRSVLRWLRETHVAMGDEGAVMMVAEIHAVGVVEEKSCPSCHGTGEDRTHAEYDALGSLDCSRCKGSGVAS